MSTEPFTPPAATAGSDSPSETSLTGAAPAVAFLVPAAGGGSHGARAPRRRPGRPLEMSADDVLRHIRQLSQRESGLFRVHQTVPGLYARARRLFGAWSRAVRSAGVDYELLQGMARARSLQSRRRNRRRATGSGGRGASPRRHE